MTGAEYLEVLAGCDRNDKGFSFALRALDEHGAAKAIEIISARLAEARKSKDLSACWRLRRSIQCIRARDAAELGGPDNE